MFQKLQNLGKSLMLPIAVLPIAGILLRLGQPDLLDIPVVASSGAAIFSQLPLLFAIGVGIGFAKDSAGAAALASAVAFFILNESLSAMNPNIDMGVLGGIVSGLVGSQVYNRFHTIKLPDWLAFFSGKRFVPIFSGFIALFLGLLFGFIWPPVQDGLKALGDFLIGAGALGMAIYGFFNRLLLAVGLHHILNTLVWFDFGEFSNSAGELVKGDLNRFFAGDPSAGVFMAGFFLIMMFGLPAAAFAMYSAAHKSQRKEVAGFLFSVAFTAFLTGITEPIEYTFMFLAPLLYLIHAIITGIFLAVSYLVGYRMGFSFSAGAIDAALS